MEEDEALGMVAPAFGWVLDRLAILFLVPAFFFPLFFLFLFMDLA